MIQQQVRGDAKGSVVKSDPPEKDESKIEQVADGIVKVTTAADTWPKVVAFGIAVVALLGGAVVGRFLGLW